jgi:osmotically-inducible protein OsmY
MKQAKQNQFYMAALSLLILWPAAQARASQKQIAKPSNSQILKDVSNELYFDRYFNPSDVIIAAEDGIVTLSGTVGNLRSKDRAIQIAEHIRGVMSVVDLLKMKPAPRTDAEIRKDVKTALLVDSATEAYEVILSVAKGLVTLKGTVNSWAEKTNAEWVTKGVRGVTDVRNDLQVKVAANRSSTEIAKDIKDRLNRNPWINNAISVDVQSDKAFLSGTVSTLLEKRKAYECAWISGINQVDLNGIKVDPTLAAPSAERVRPRTETADIVAAVKEAFSDDPRIGEFKIEVSFATGVATLKGEVISLKAKRAAGQDAKNAEGVFQVVNDLSISKKGRSDSVITAEVRSMLLTDPLVDLWQVHVVTKNGVVTLTGLVDTIYEKYYAEDDASRIAGVREVNDRIRVQMNPALKISLTDNQLEQNLRQAITFDPYVNSDDKVNFTVKKGKVVFTGTVHSWFASINVVNDALVAGARSVENRLKGENADIPKEAAIVRPFEFYKSYWMRDLPWIARAEILNEGSKSGTTQAVDGENSLE